MAKGVRSGVILTYVVVHLLCEQLAASFDARQPCIQSSLYSIEPPGLCSASATDEPAELVHGRVFSSKSPDLARSKGAPFLSSERL